MEEETKEAKVKKLDWQGLKEEGTKDAKTL